MIIRTPDGCVDDDDDIVLNSITMSMLSLRIWRLSQANVSNTSSIIPMFQTDVNHCFQNRFYQDPINHCVRRSWFA